MANKKKTKHRHRASSEHTRPGSGDYVETCSCGATRTRSYRGQAENVEPTITLWSEPGKRAKAVTPPSTSSVVNQLPSGIYEHYKGGRYLLLHLAHHHDTREMMVVYLSLEKGTINVRPLHGSKRDPDGWLNQLPGGVERFKYIGPAK